MPPLSSPEQQPATQPQRIGWWLWLQMISLDAPLVIVAWLAALARSHRLHLMPEFYLGLGAATWLIYLLDRTADAMSGALPEPMSARHAFSRRWRYALLGLLAPLLLAYGVWLAMYRLPWSMCTQAVAVGVLCLWYLAFQAPVAQWAWRVVYVTGALSGSLVFMEHLPIHSASLRMLVTVGLLWFSVWVIRCPQTMTSRRLVLKEVLAAFLVTLGCSAAVEFWSPSPSGVMSAETLLLWALVTLNLIIIHTSERIAGQHEIAPTEALPWFYQIPGQRVLAGALALTSLVVALSQNNGGTRAVALSIALAAALSLLLHLRIKNIHPEIFHLLADLALVLPLPLVWLLAPS